MLSKNEGIRVFVRVRPPVSEDINHDTAVFVSGSTVSVTDAKRDISCSYGTPFDLCLVLCFVLSFYLSSNECSIEHVFQETASQDDVFQKVQPLLNDVLNGYNGCIFAYGQTSAGKTHTMLGRNGGMSLENNSFEWGLLPRSAFYLFDVSADYICVLL